MAPVVKSAADFGVGEERGGLQLLFVGVDRVARGCGADLDGLGLSGPLPLSFCMVSYHAPLMALANFSPEPSGRFRHFAAHDEQVEDLAGDLRGIEDGVDAFVGEDLRDERLPGDDGLIRRIVHKCGNDVGVGGVDQAELGELGLLAVEHHAALEQILRDRLLDQHDGLAGELVEGQSVATRTASLPLE